MPNKQEELTKLPRRFKVTKKEDRYIITTKLKDIPEDFDNVNLIVDEWASDNNLRLLGCGVNLLTIVRDWSFKK